MEHESKENGPRIHQQRVAEIQGAILYGPDGESIADVIDRPAPRKPRPEGRGQGELYKNGNLPYREAPPGRAGRLHNLFRNDGWRDEHPVNYLTISSMSYEEASEIQQVLKEHDASFIGFYSGIDMAPFFQKSRGLDWAGVFVLWAEEK
jgi:hypothetical protein